MIIIDNEFKTLIPPLTDDEYSGLESSLLKEGCRDALVLWGNILIDGHNRYEICTKHHIPFNTVQRYFPDRQSVINWIILNQFSRRNISSMQRSELALKLKSVIAEKAKEHQGARTDLNILQNSAKCSEKIDTRKELAEIAGVSHDTIAKVETILEKAPEPVIEAARADKLSVNSAYQVTKMQPDEQSEISQRIQQGETPKEVVKDVQKRPHVSFNSGNNEWYTPKEYITAALSVMGSIDLDPATSEIANKVVNAGHIYTAETNGLENKWFGNIWLNPPYSSDLIGKFANKLVNEKYSQAIVLVNNSTETEWFNKIISVSSAVCFPQSRVKFYKPDGSTGAPLQGQAVLYIGDNAVGFINAFKKFGWCAYLDI